MLFLASDMTQKLNEAFAPVVSFLEKIIFWDVAEAFGVPIETSVPFVVVWLIIGGVFFTIRFRFINMRGFKHALQLVSGKYAKRDDVGEVSHFQALTTALSATVGLGNIAGVAIAITVGGPGAIVWMIFAGFFGMSLKFMECTLGLKYRRVSKSGTVSGGPMYYLERGLAKQGLRKLGKTLAVFYAVMLILASFGGGNMLQANQAFAQLASVAPSFGNAGIWVGACLALLVGTVIIGGIKSIAKVTSKLVPIMAVIYIAASLFIIAIHFKEIPSTIWMIVKEAFQPSAMKGGMLGVLITGFRRGAFSNEAGIGSASIAHSAARTKIPIREGFVALLEPFIDTIVICTMTALVIVFSGVYQEANGLDGAPLTSKAFESVIWWYPYILVVAIFLFAFSTMISWSYYGQKGFTYLFPSFLGNQKLPKFSYQVLFLLFIVLGAATQLNDVIAFSDMMILGLAFPNLLGLYFLTKEIVAELKSYQQYYLS